MEPMKNIPVYRHSAAYAVEHGELEAYKTSRVAGVACRDAIEKAVAKHYRDNCLNKAGAREVIDEFGKERVMTVLAITIRDKLYDGRFSSANKAWAQAFPIEPDIDSWGGNRNLTLVVRQTHPGLLNLFCDQAKAYESEKVSVREKLKAAAKNAPVPSTKKEMDRALRIACRKSISARPLPRWNARAFPANAGMRIERSSASIRCWLRCRKPFAGSALGWMNCARRSAASRSSKARMITR